MYPFVKIAAKLYHAPPKKVRFGLARGMQGEGRGTIIHKSLHPALHLKTICIIYEHKHHIMPFLQDKIVLRSALPRSNSLMSSCSTKQGVLSRISIVMFTHQQNTIVCAVWNTKYGSAGLDAANEIITNEIKKFLE